jgi:predicted lipid carrier protein YhbT
MTGWATDPASGFTQLLERMPPVAHALAGAPASLALATALNIAFERFPAELDLLEGKRVCMQATDLPVRIFITVRGGVFAVCRPVADPDVLIRAGAADFVRLACRRVDADTLFFARRLLIEGDTEAGLLLKNSLDALDPAAMLRNPPAPHRVFAALRAAAIAAIASETDRS